MMIVSQFRQLNLSVVNVRTYLFAVLLSEEKYAASPIVPFNAGWR